MNSTYQMLIKILKEKLGIVFMDETQDDFAITDYVYESIQFINFIIIIEEELGIELTDDFLNYEILNSAKGFCKKLDYFIESN